MASSPFRLCSVPLSSIVLLIALLLGCGGRVYASTPSVTVVPLAQASRLAQADDAFDEGLRLLDRGRTQDLQAALTQFNQALRLYREIGSREGEADALFEIGWTYHLLENHQQSLDFYNQALPGSPKAVRTHCGDG